MDKDESSFYSKHYNSVKLFVYPTTDISRIVSISLFLSLFLLYTILKFLDFQKSLSELPKYNLLITSNSISGDEDVISTLFSGYDKSRRPDFGKYVMMRELGFK